MGTEMTHPQDECFRTQDPGIHGSWVWSPDNRDTSDPLDLGYASIQGSGPWMVLLLLLWTLWGPGEQETITSNTHVAQGPQPCDIRCMQVVHILYNRMCAQWVIHRIHRIRGYPDTSIHGIGVIPQIHGSGVLSTLHP